MAIYMKDAKSAHLLHQTLACLVQALRGEYVLIDLRNDSSVRGRILDADGYMNVEMEDCIYQNPRGQFYPFETFFIRGRNIRYVHIPKGVKPTQIMERHLGRIHEKVLPVKKRTFKESRSLRYQREIMQEIALKDKSNEASTSQD